MAGKPPPKSSEVHDKDVDLFDVIKKPLEELLDEDGSLKPEPKDPDTTQGQSADKISGDDGAPETKNSEGDNETEPDWWPTQNAAEAEDIVAEEDAPKLTGEDLKEVEKAESPIKAAMDAASDETDEEPEEEEKPEDDSPEEDQPESDEPEEQEENPNDNAEDMPADPEGTGTTERPLKEKPQKGDIDPDPLKDDIGAKPIKGKPHTSSTGPSVTDPGPDSGTGQVKKERPQKGDIDWDPHKEDLAAKPMKGKPVTSPTGPGVVDPHEQKRQPSKSDFGEFTDIMTASEPALKSGSVPGPRPKKKFRPGTKPTLGPIDQDEKSGSDGDFGGMPDGVGNPGTGGI